MGWNLEYTPVSGREYIGNLAPLCWPSGWRAVPWAGAFPFIGLMVLQPVCVPRSNSHPRTWQTRSSGRCFRAPGGPTVTAGLWFALEYADLRRWLVRRNLILLALHPFLWLLLILTNHTYGLIWSGFSFDGSVQPIRNAGAWIFVTFGSLLGLATIVVFAWLFWRSPLHRVPVALCLCGQAAVRAAYGLKTAGTIPAVPVDPVILTFNFTAIMYALALFRFRLFNLIPIARGTVIDQMHEGMLVLDGERRIMDLNPAAEKILAVSAARARGANLADLLPECSLGERSEITLGTGGDTRHYALHESALNDRRGLRVGTLILLDDVTRQKQAQAQLMEQQRALATLHERDRVARELHDTLGQVLGYIKMQAAVAQTFLEREELPEAKRRVARLGAAAQDAQIDVREYILGTRAGLSGTAPLVPALRDYLRQFSENYGIATELNAPPALADRVFDPMTGAQLLRIIQEALTNVRKHAQAQRVDIRIAVRDGSAEATVQDDGAGFDPARVRPAGGHRFGLQVMRERAEEVGARVQVHSAPARARGSSS